MTRQITRQIDSSLQLLIISELHIRAWALRFRGLCSAVAGITLSYYQHNLGAMTPRNLKISHLNLALATRCGSTDSGLPFFV